MAFSTIKLFLVEDSSVVLEILSRIFQSTPKIEIVGTASNGEEAIAKIPKLQPDVLCTDLIMNKVDGLELTRQLMATFPLPILVISNAVQQSDTENISQLLQAGAVDIFPKPQAGLLADYEKQKQVLINKIEILAGVKVFTKPLRPSNPTPVSQPAPILKSDLHNNSNFEIVTMGASTGGPQAIFRIVGHLPANFALPILCTQHIGEGFLQGLIDWLKFNCQLKIKIAAVGETPQPGTLYFAPERYHLELDSNGRFIYSFASAIDGHCPSVTAMFRSVAQCYGSSTIGILLTGMGRDGAAGMQAIAQVGGLTIAQDEASSVIFGMPQQAIALGAAEYVLPVDKIAPFLLNLTHNL